MAAYKKDNWRSNCRDIAAMQNEARKRGILTDIQFMIETQVSLESFHAHKLILACGSPVFEKMFYGDLVETKNVIMLDDDTVAFEMLLNYLYGKTEKIHSLVCAWNCYTIGDKYLVSGLKKYAEKYMLSSAINEDKFWDITKNNIYLNEYFKEKVDVFIKENASKLFKSQRFQYVPDDVINNILVMDELNATEYELLLTVTKWAYTTLIECNSECLLLFYKHIRFSSLTSSVFCEFVHVFPNAIDAKHSLKILMHLSNRSAYKLPEWCCTSLLKRNSRFQKNSDGYKCQKMDF